MTADLGAACLLLHLTTRRQRVPRAAGMQIPASAAGLFSLLLLLATHLHLLHPGRCSCCRRRRGQLLSPRLALRRASRSARQLFVRRRTCVSQHGCRRRRRPAPHSCCRHSDHCLPASSTTSCAAAAPEHHLIPAASAIGRKRGVTQRRRRRGDRSSEALSS